MSDALQQAAGDRLRKILQRLTGNRLSAALTGAGVTAAANSSSVTTVILIGFMTAGLMSLQQAMGVLLGANVGSTITAQLIAFKVTTFYTVLVAAGLLLTFFKKPLLRHIGNLTFGLGLIFLGMDIMGTATTPLRDWPVFTDAMQRIANPALGILAGAVVTAAIQSSAATTGMVIVLASSGDVSLEAGISIALGANIGTCVTAVLAAIGKPRAAVQAAVAHILINVIGVIIWLPMLGWFAEIIRWISPTAPTDFTVAEQLAATVPRQIANAHTLLNVVNCLAFLPLTGVLAWLVTRLVPTPNMPSDAIDELLASSPQNSDMALVQANLAQQHLFTASEALLLELSREN